MLRFDSLRTTAAVTHKNHIHGIEMDAINVLIELDLSQMIALKLIDGSSLDNVHVTGHWEQYTNNPTFQLLYLVYIMPHRKCG